MTTPTPIPQLPDRVNLQDAPKQLNTNDKAFWMIGWNDCVDAMKSALSQQPSAVVPERRTFDQWWTEVENFGMRGERLCELLSKPALAQVAYDEGLAAAPLLPAGQQDAPSGEAAVQGAATPKKAPSQGPWVCLKCHYPKWKHTKIGPDRWECHIPSGNGGVE